MRLPRRWHFGSDHDRRYPAGLHGNQDIQG